MNSSEDQKSSIVVARMEGKAVGDLLPESQ